MSLRGLWDQLRANYAARPQNEQRIILGLLVAVVLGMVYVGIWVPVTDYRADVADQIERGQEELERQARFLGTADSLRAERDAIKKKVDAARKELLPGNSGTLGAAALQDLASNAANKAGVTVQSTQVMKEEEVAPFRKVAIRMTLSAELKPLADLVSTLEFTNHLVVPFIEISRRGAVAAGNKGPRTLQATVEVSGFVRAGDGKEGKDAKEPEAGEPVTDGGAAPADTLPPPEEGAAEGGAPAGGAPAGGVAAPAVGGAVAPKADTGAPATATTAAGATSTTTIPAAPAPGAPAATPANAAPDKPGVTPTTAAPEKPAAATGPTLTTSTIPPPIVIPAAPPGSLPAPPPATAPKAEGEQ